MTLPSGPHGGDGRLLAASYGLDPASVLDLSVSLNPFAPPPGAVVARHLEARRGLHVALGCEFTKIEKRGECLHAETNKGDVIECFEVETIQRAL